jgi:hypothetical protein
MLQVLNKIDLPGAEPDRVVREIEEVGAKKLKDSMSNVCGHILVLVILLDGRDAGKIIYIFWVWSL